MTIKVEMTYSPDVKVIAAIHDACFAKSWSAEAIEGLLAVKGTAAFLTRDGSGFALARHLFEEAEILTVCVTQAQRGRGVGRALIASLATWAGQQGAESVFLEVSERNEAARKLYEHNGFGVVARRNEYYQNPDGSHDHALVMRRLLK